MSSSVRAKLFMVAVHFSAAIAGILAGLWLVDRFN